MSGDLFDDLEQGKPTQVFLDEDCALCIDKSGEYNWNQVCCRARFILDLPGVDWRREWLAHWKHRENPDFYAAIEQAVKSRWAKKVEAANV